MPKKVSSIFHWPPWSASNMHAYFNFYLFFFLISSFLKKKGKEKKKKILRAPNMQLITLVSLKMLTSSMGSAALLASMQKTRRNETIQSHEKPPPCGLWPKLYQMQFPNQCRKASLKTWSSRKRAVLINIRTPREKPSISNILYAFSSFLPLSNLYISSLIY